LEAVLEAVRADIAAWEGAPVLAFRYLKVNKKETRRFGGLTPPLPILRGFLMDRLSARDHLAVEYMSALIAETATQALDKEDLAPLEQVAAEGIRFDASAAWERGSLQSPFDFSPRNMQF